MNAVPASVLRTTALPGPALPGGQTLAYAWRCPLSRHPHRIQAYVPAGAVPAGGFPAIVLLDGNAVFRVLREQPALLPTQAILIGLGYDDSEIPVPDARTYDYTPRRIAGVVNYDPRVPTRRAGGAPDFLDALAGTLLPALAAELPLDTRHLTLYGHSYGGMLTLYTLFERPSLFQRHVAVSPSLWWHDGDIQQRADHWATSVRPVDSDVLVMVGGAEKRHPKPQEGEQPRPDGVPTAPLARALATGLAALPGVHCEFEELPGRSHGEMLAASLPAAFRFALRQPAQTEQA